MIAPSFLEILYQIRLAIEQNYTSTTAKQFAYLRIISKLYGI